ncbi:MAG: hypothetical protein ACR2RB_16365 [Gammaproteobacteria bacterium]
MLISVLVSCTVMLGANAAMAQLASPDTTIDAGAKETGLFSEEERVITHDPFEDDFRFTWNLTNAIDAYPHLQGEVFTGLEFESESNGDTANDLYVPFDAFFVLRFTPRLSLNTELEMEPVDGPPGGEFRTFDNEGLYLETLLLDYELGWFSLFGGKFEPAGEVFFNAPTFFGNFVTDDFDLDERIGIGLSMDFGARAIGAHNVTAYAFYVDTTILSESAFTNRGRTLKADGGVGNTERLDNFMLTLHGGNFSAAPAFRYTLGATQQQGTDALMDETSYIGSLIAVDDRSGFSVEADYLYQQNADGEAEDLRAITAGVSYRPWPWFFGASYGAREIIPQSDEPVTDDRLIELLSGYDFDNGFYVELAYRRLIEDDGEREHSFGVLLEYGFDFLIH